LRPLLGAFVTRSTDPAVPIPSARIGHTARVTEELRAGLYETLVDEVLAEGLRSVDVDLLDTEPIRPAEAGDRIAHFVGDQLRSALGSVPDKERVRVGVDLARRIVDLIASDIHNSAPLRPGVDGKVLHEVARRRPDGSVGKTARPWTPVLDTTVLTNAQGEPRVGAQILTEIESADAIDLVMAFIFRSGIRPLLPALRRHCEAGRELRILTTTFTGSTEPEALDQLRDLGAEVKISYDVTTTRLHAKAWIFHRGTGFSTAYVGSSNLSHSAQNAGMEWNVRLSSARNPDALDKMNAVFSSYWGNGDFIGYDRDVFAEAVARPVSASSHSVLSPIEIRLEPFQERLLELISVSREQGHHRNLLVSATGTGKTVMAALDFALLRDQLSRSRLLFVAHREEILDQSLATFRHALRDQAFGEKWVGRSRPRNFDHVFASIQSLNAGGMSHLDPDHFDVVIVDEFHHAAAPSYRRLLDHVRPRELLGLTATPERTDGLEILHWFDDRIAAELRLWDAIDQHRLTPFVYYGVHDGVDLRDIPWRRGKGYDVDRLTNAYTSDAAWARLVIKQLEDHVDDLGSMRCLAFCVSIDHAKFMADHLNSSGIKAVAVWGDSPEDDRRTALRNLAQGLVQVVCSVDLFNEGIDVPAVDVVLMLRPTESATLFLQQLGRGLRRSADKSLCTVLDFVGTHRTEFRFDRRFRALLGGSRRDVERAVETGFPFLPAGCHMELDAVAREVVLRSIRSAIPSRWPQKVAELRELASRSGADVSLGTYLTESGLDLSDVYDARSWSDLREAAGLPVLAAGPFEKALRRSAGRLRHVDDAYRLGVYGELARSPRAPEVALLSRMEKRLAHMLVADTASHVLKGKKLSLQEAVDLLWGHPQVLAELSELFGLLSDRVDHLHAAASPDWPLQIHARYSRAEILAAMGEGASARTPPWQSGVYEAKAARVDLLAFTLDKTSGSFSPTTRYRDYAESRGVIHWESQGATAADSKTGRRYQNHVAMNRSILLFARERADDRAFWFLGPATYIEHQGERPMAVRWKLDVPLPGDLYVAFAAAVA